MVQVQVLLARIGHWMEMALVAVCAALLCFLVVSVFLEVLIRYVIHAPTAWTEEVARFILVWFGLLAAAVSARRGMHFAVRFGVMYFNERTRWIVRQIVNVAVVVLLSILLKYSIDYLDIVSNQTAMATEIDMRIPYAGIPVGIGAILTIYVLELADAVLSIWTGRRFSAVEAREEEVHRELKGESLS
ncbi:MAG TPA: TRAP transporter small permease [Nitrospira sp.]|nr:TRAP transporter small permease [Nitrospira sp.]HSF69570.1 TRAP transporter small permease [Nitrospira sp.]